MGIGTPAARATARKSTMVDHCAGVLVDILGFVRCASAPQFFWSAKRQVEVHMDDVRGFGPDPQVVQGGVSCAQSLP